MNKIMGYFPHGKYMTQYVIPTPGVILNEMKNLIRSFAKLRMTPEVKYEVIK